MKSHFGSTLAIVFGYLFMFSSFAPSAITVDGAPDFDTLVMGFLLIVGGHAYCSAKKRLYKDVGTSIIGNITRISFEFSAIALVIASVVMKNNIYRLIENDPFTELVIPTGIVIAYLIVFIRVIFTGTVNSGIIYQCQKLWIRLSLW